MRMKTRRSSSVICFARRPPPTRVSTSSSGAVAIPCSRSNRQATMPLKSRSSRARSERNVSSARRIPSRQPSRSAFLPDPPVPRPSEARAGPCGGCGSAQSRVSQSRQSGGAVAIRAVPQDPDQAARRYAGPPVRAHPQGGAGFRRHRRHQHEALRLVDQRPEPVNPGKRLGMRLPAFREISQLRRASPDCDPQLRAAKRMAPRRRAPSRTASPSSRGATRASKFLECRRCAGWPPLP